MIEELRERLPEELVWNVLKYTTHPLAEMLIPVFKSYQYHLKTCECVVITHVVRSSMFSARKKCITCTQCRIFMYRRNRYYAPWCKSCWKQMQDRSVSDSDSDSDSG